jgi:WD40 repeat protein
MFSPDGAMLMGPGLWQNGGQIRLWDATNGALLRTLAGHGGGLWDDSISPTGDVVVTVGWWLCYGRARNRSNDSLDDVSVERSFLRARRVMVDIKHVLRARATLC